MNQIPTTTDISLFHQVADDYHHTPKIVRPTSALNAPQIYLKWYLVQPEARPISETEVKQAQTFLLDEVAAGHLTLKNEVGFVVQHRCTAADILYVCSWRNNNEVWETLYHKSIEENSAFQVAQRETKTGTFCVWVIPVVTHEQQAWVRFLKSRRDAAAQLIYCEDQFVGIV